jgi:hypothetical protein
VLRLIEKGIGQERGRYRIGVKLGTSSCDVATGILSDSSVSLGGLHTGYQLAHPFFIL